MGANGVATVTMVRADKHNALDQAMFEGLMNAAEKLADDTSVRAVVLHGEGKSFCCTNYSISLSQQNLRTLIKAQSGDASVIENPGSMPTAKLQL